MNITSFTPSTPYPRYSFTLSRTILASPTPPPELACHAPLGLVKATGFRATASGAPTMHKGGVKEACHSTADGSALREPSAAEMRTTAGTSLGGCGFLSTSDGVCPKLWICARAASRRRGSYDICVGICIDVCLLGLGGKGARRGNAKGT